MCYMDFVIYYKFLEGRGLFFGFVVIGFFVIVVLRCVFFFLMVFNCV